LYPTDGVPAGVDNAWHTFSALRILDTGNPLVIYSQFPTIIRNFTNFYPSFFHLTVASISQTVGFNQGSETNPTLLLEVEKSFMLAVSLAGTAGYAIFIRSLLNASIADKIRTNSGLLATNSHYRLLHLIISALAFSLFIFSVTPVNHTYSDGTYGQVFAMWLLFPYYMYSLVNGHWKLSGILLAAIASSHNLAIIMSLAATLPYLVSLALHRAKNLRKNILKFALTFFICAIPAFIFFYLTPLVTLLTAGVTEETPAGLTTPHSMATVIQEIKPGLYYLGITCVFLLLVLSYRTFGWIAGWVSIYFVVFGISTLIGERFGRELGVVFGIVIAITVGYGLLTLVALGRKQKTPLRSLDSESIRVTLPKLIIVVIFSVSIVPLWYYYFHDRLQPNPLTVKYFTETIDESNKFFIANASSDQNRGVIVVLGANPWLKVITFGKFDVLEVQPSTIEATTSGGDRRINQELNEIFLSADASNTACILKKYKVDFVYVSTHNLPGRFYTPEQIDADRQLEVFQTVDSSRFLVLEEEYMGKNKEHIRIFSVDNDNVNASCSNSEQV
jgi:hypothetical protein